MIDLTLPLYCYVIALGGPPWVKLFTPEFQNSLTSEGKFFLNSTKAFGYNALLPRAGEWKTPWKTAVAPGAEMPVYNAQYSNSFENVSDMRALDVKKLINEGGKKFAVFYSGGIDSTLTVVALLKNLTEEELNNVYIAMSPDSIIENPNFYYNFIQNKLKILDSQKNMYSDFLNQGFICISSDAGDSIFGTELGTKMYSQFKEISNTLPTNIQKSVANLYYDVISKDVHFSNYKDLIIAYFNSNLSTPSDRIFGQIFYEKLVNNINTSPVPINSLHDFFWWMIFNIKYMHCALRPGFLYSLGNNRKEICVDGTFNWYGSIDYQLWSMANNNNGQKINGPRQSSYKTAARNYIYEFDKNYWYYRHKLKIASLPIIRYRNLKKYYKDHCKNIAMNSNYDILFLDDPGVNDFIINGIRNL